MGCELIVPDHTTLARPSRTLAVNLEVSTNKRSTDIALDSTGLKFFGSGAWARQKHGEVRRTWRKFHISVDPCTGEIRANELTDDSVSHSTMVGPLVAASGNQIKRVFADRAYDGDSGTEVIRAVRPARSPPKIIAQPRKGSIRPPNQAHGGSERECHAAEIAKYCRMNWQKRHDYEKRALMETAVSRIKKP